MTAVPSYFTDFLAEIRLTGALQNACREKHLDLRARLRDDSALSKVIVDAFLQGSLSAGHRCPAAEPRGSGRARGR